MRRFFLFLMILSLAYVTWGQEILPIGQWRNHLSSSSSITSALVGSRIYSGARSSFFYYDIKSGETKSLSKSDGFSQSDVSFLAYSQSAKTLVIAYENSQVDLLTDDGKIYKFNDIRNYNVSGDKSIRHILIEGNIAYISTGFGLVAYDLANLKVLDAYQSFDDDVLVREVYASAVLSDTIYVATSSGVYYASLAKSINRLDYSNWKSIPNMQANSIIAYNNRVFLASTTKSNTDTIYVYQNKGLIYDANLALVNAFRGNKTLGFSISNGKLWVTKQAVLFLYSTEGSSIEYLVSNRDFKPRNVISTSENERWISDETSGLLKIVSSQDKGTVYGPNGPSVSSVLRFSHSNILAVSGGYDGNYTAIFNRDGYSYLKDGIWSNYKSSFGNFPNEFTDVTSSVYNKKNNKYYFTSWTRGVLEWDGEQEFTIYNQDTPGCLLQSCSFVGFCEVPGAPYCRIADMDVDSRGDMWILNPTPEASRDNSGSLFKYSLDGTWRKFVWTGIGPLDGHNYNNNDNDNSPHFYTNRIHIDKYDNKWIACRPGGDKMGGLMVFNESKYNLPRYLTYRKGVKEEICGLKVNCIVSDNDGAVWIGTDNGVCYFSNPEDVFQRRSIKAAVPVFENRALLKGQNITSIDVDGSNRKWIGTKSGIWLFSSDGSKLVVHFDESNSPLPSSNIVDIKVDQKSGEVFIATDKGIMSYGGNSVPGEETNNNVIVYPNPIDKNFDGYVAISGLVNNALVKITDISGKLVFQTKAEGSLASWNVKDYLGRRPQAGIYLIFSSKEDGSEALVNKIAIID